LGAVFLGLRLRPDVDIPHLMHGLSSLDHLDGRGTNVQPNGLDRSTPSETLA
jgi:hypothetical protein